MAVTREIHCVFHQKVGEYNQKIPQSQTVDHPMALWARITEVNSHNTSGKQLKQNKHLSVFLTKMIAKLEGH